MKAFCVDAQWQPKPSYKISGKEEMLHDAPRGDCVWRYPRGILSDMPVPEITADEVLIKVGACGVCGSDLHMLETDGDGYMRYPGRTVFPVIIGHEFAGEVVQKGSNVSTIDIGDIVSAEPTLWCGKCRNCRMGMYNQCTGMEEIGFSINGGFAEYVAVNEKLCYSINDMRNKHSEKQMVFDEGALVEPAAVAYTGMFSVAGGIHVGGAMAVFGGGPVGIAAIGLGIAAGASRIFAFDTEPSRREIAKKAGADFVYDPIELFKSGIDAGDIILEHTHGVGASTIIEATGNTSAVYSSIAKSVAVDGKIIQLGMDTRKTNVDFTLMQSKCAQWYGSVGQTGLNVYPSVIQLMASGRLNLLPMVTDRFNLCDIKKGIDAFAGKKGCKVLISCNY